MEDSNKLSYFLLGLGLGVAAGLLFAPQSGEDTRGLIKSKTGEGTDYLKRRSEDLRESAANAFERGRDTIARQRENLAAAVDAGKQAYREALSNVGTPAAGAGAAATGGEGI
jgi:gas vesicle protein